MAESGPRTIGTTAAERIELYQSWSNPVRRRILAHLAEHGPANSTVLAKALAESTGTTSYHLRKLAEQQLIEEVEERSTGRERWWRASSISMRTPPRSQMTPEEQAASAQIASMRASHDFELYLRLTSDYDAGSGWVDGDRFGTALTEEEVSQFVAEYRALCSKYARSLYEAPAGARQMAVRFFVVPDEMSEMPLGSEAPDSSEG